MNLWEWNILKNKYNNLTLIFYSKTFITWNRREQKRRRKRRETWLLTTNGSVRFCGNARYPRKVRGRRTQARDGGRERESERDSYFASETTERDRNWPRRSLGSETRSGIHAARQSECVYVRLFVVVRFVPRAAWPLRRADYATRGHESAPRSRECSRSARSRACPYRLAGLAGLSYLAMCLQQQIGMRKLLNFQTPSHGYYQI